MTALPGLTVERVAEIRAQAAEHLSYLQKAGWADVHFKRPSETIALCDFYLATLARRAGEADDWQPIETAPRDGTRILACNADPKASYIIVGYFRYGSFTDGQWPLITVTHWRPLPAPPHDNAGGEK